MVTSKIKFLVVILLSSCNIHLSRGHNEVSKEHHRVRRGPAVWGAPVPDYSAVKLDGDSTYIYGILFLDARIVSDYFIRYNYLHSLCFRPITTITTLYGSKKK